MNQPRPSMHRQHSLISHCSLRSQRSLRPQGSRRSSTHLPARQGEPKQEAEVQVREPAPQGSESKGTGELQGHGSGSADSGENPNATSTGQGTPLSQVAKSAFEGWNAQVGTAKVDQVKHFWQCYKF